MVHLNVGLWMPIKLEVSPSRFLRVKHDTWLAVLLYKRR